MPDPLVIRRAKPDDADALSDILAHSFESMFRFSLGLSAEQTAYILGELYRQGLMDSEETWVAEKAGRVVGLAVLAIRPSSQPKTRGAYWPAFRQNLGVLGGLRALVGNALLNAIFERRIPKGDLAYLRTLAVLPADRGREVGTALIEHCLKEARQAGCPTLALHVLRRNEGARRLYERMGFVTRSNQASPARLMERSVAAPPAASR